MPCRSRGHHGRRGVQLCADILRNIFGEIKVQQCCGLFMALHYFTYLMPQLCRIQVPKHQLQAPKVLFILLDIVHFIYKQFTYKLFLIKIIKIPIDISCIII